MRLRRVLIMLCHVPRLWTTLNRRLNAKLKSGTSIMFWLLNWVWSLLGVPRCNFCLLCAGGWRLSRPSKPLASAVAGQMILILQHCIYKRETTWLMMRSGLLCRKARAWTISDALPPPTGCESSSAQSAQPLASFAGWTSMKREECWVVQLSGQPT